MTVMKGKTRKEATIMAVVMYRSSRKEVKSSTKFDDQMVNFYIHLNQKLSALNGCSN